MSLCELIESKALNSVFQPIVDTYRSTVLGYESLIRGPSEHRLAMPGALFSEADRLDLREKLESYCVNSAVNSFNTAQFNGALFINVDPNILCQQGCLADFASLSKFNPANIVLELSEHYPIHDVQLLKKQLHRMRAAGYRFAIDDLGAGHSSFKLWAEIRPDFIKIDRYFIKDIDASPYKREFVQHMTTLAKNLHATVIAEGIETEGELRQLQKLGIFAMQGFFIARPGPAPMPGSVLTEILSQEAAPDRYDSVNALIEDATVVSSQRKVTDILDYFRQNKRLVAIPVVDKYKVKGIIRRGQFMELMSTAFGRALYASKPVSAVMQTNYLVVEANAPIEQASALLTEHEDTIEQQVLLVVNQGGYVGIVPVPSLLRRITELRIQNARYANPLTLLPGNVPINQIIDQSIASAEHFFVLYFDLNYFKPFNDVYGYHQGDAVIQWFAQLLYEHYASERHFVGHVGGDDFIVVIQGEDNCLKVLDRLKAAFTREITSFYRAEHIQEGAMLARARDGRYQKFALLDFSLALVAVPPSSALSHQEIALAAAKLKGKAKRAKDGVAHYTFAPTTQDSSLQTSGALARA